MISVNYNDTHTFKMPTDWNELSGSQLIAIAPYLFKKQVSTQEMGVIVYTLCGFGKVPLSSKAQRTKGGYDYFANELQDKLFPHIKFLFEENKLTKQIITEIKVGAKYQFFGTRFLYGPADNFDNLTLAEFSDTESCLDNFDTTQEDIWLDRFLAVLYRPKKKIYHPHHADFDGDIRQPYNFHLNDFIATMVQKVPVNVKLAVVLWYTGCRNDFVSNNQFLFSKSNSDKAKETGGWTDVMHGLAGPKFGTVEQTGRTNLKVIARELKELHKHAQEFKAQHGT